MRQSSPRSQRHPVVRSKAAFESGVEDTRGNKKQQLLLVGEGSDERYGARPLKRAIHRRLVMPLSAVLATGQIKPGTAVEILADYDAGTDEVFFVPYLD